MCLRTIYCGRPKVRVIEPSGHARHFSAPIAIPELLHLYPHHCVHHVSGSILSPDAELQGGHTYLLSPTPRLFTGSPSSSENRHSCSCFLHKEEENDDTAIALCLSIWKPRDPVMRARRDPNPQRFSRRSTQEWDKKHNRSNKTLRRVQRSWQPSLDMISENDTLLQTCKNEQPVKKTEKKTAKPRKYTFNQSARTRVTESDLQAMLPSGFMF